MTSGSAGWNLSPRVLGIDGCRAGWVGILLAPDGPDVSDAPDRRVVGATAPTVDALIAAVRAAAPVGPLDAIGIDMPVHPPEAGQRPADRAAREHLGRKASSIFLTPARPVLEAGSYVEACAVARALDGRAISRQAWALRGKILEVEAWLATAPCPVYEVHPEVSFSVLTGAPILASKRTWSGLAARWRALEGAGILVPTEVGGAGGVAPDDVLDAAIVAWSARRIATGVARTFPDPPEVLGDGRTVAIWA